MSLARAALQTQRRGFSGPRRNRNKHAVKKSNSIVSRGEIGGQMPQRAELQSAADCERVRGVRCVIGLG